MAPVFAVLSAVNMYTNYKSVEVVQDVYLNN